ncbi:MAG TPA: FkbM family methyltransferase [Actinomycetota bacterium]
MSEDTDPRDPLLPNQCAEEHPVLLSLLTEVLMGGDVFVDVGANIGYFAVPMAKIVGSAGHVHAFEPAADVAEQLRRAARAQGVEPWMTVHELALGSGNGSTSLSADPEHPEDTTKRSLFMLNGPAVAEVLVRSFDGLVTSGAVDLSTGLHAVKIDVEGGEMHVLTGMRRTLERDRPRMIVVETIETHLRRAGFTVAAIHAFMRDLGYVAMNDAGVARALELNAVFVPA